MEGFFTKKETESISRPDGKVLSCVSCNLSKGCASPKMPISGDYQKGILNISTRPSNLEDKRGQAFVGKEARLLKTVYAKVGIDLEKDCLNTYAVRCASEKAPSKYQVDCCRKFLLKIIDKHKPKIIVLFGNDALYSIIGNRWKKDLGNINKWQGWNIPDQDLNAWVCPTFDPDSVLNAKTKVNQVIWRKDLQKISVLVNKSIPKYEEPDIYYLKDDLSILDNITVGNIAFDYETTGLKPHAKGHKIICASVAINKDTVYTFMLPPSRKKRKPFTDLLQRKTVGKIAQNIKYEDTWTLTKLRIPVVNWLWDTMQATHIIDNRPGVTGLKFQTYVQFGIIDYDSEVSPYLKAKDNSNANAINRIEELLEQPEGKEKLLKYCALDSIYEYRLAMLQRKHMAGTQGLTPISPIKSDYIYAYKLMHKGILALAKSERHGLRIDMIYAERMKRRLSLKIKKVEKEFFASKFFRHWQHVTKGKVNLNSGMSLGNYLYNVKKIEPAKLTDTGKGSTDEEALKMLKIPELDLLLKRSKLLNLKNTFLEGISKEAVNGILHPFFNLHLVVTYRSSSNSPNFQNLPKRDKESMQIIRRAIYPSPGNQLLEMDYSGIEVAIATCYHKDPNMIKYLSNPKSDLHGDMAKQIFMIDDWDKSRSDHSMLRGAAKNGFVFPEFYGDYYRNCAANICSSWIEMPLTKWKPGMGVELNNGVPIGKYLISKGIKSYEDFVTHIQKIEKHFWTRRFPQYAKWKETHYKQYLKDGYVSLMTGFTCGGVMGKNNVINYPVQGAAFHCLLWTMIEVTKQLEEKGFKSRLVGQIHDAIVGDIVPAELHAVHDLIQHVGTVELRKAFPWIIVPLKLDAELCPVDGSWAEKEKWKPEADLPF